MVNKPTDRPVPLTDFQSFARVSEINQDGPKRPNPDNPSILSPVDATVFLKTNQPIAAADVKASDTRRAWLTGGTDRYDPFILNWSGPLDSSYDWVGFGFMRANQWYLAAGTTDQGWQWATRGSPYNSGWKPYHVEQLNGYNAGAWYFIWVPQRGMYMAV
jgi:hypothetical protein